MRRIILSYKTLYNILQEDHQYIQFHGCDQYSESK